MNDDIQERLTDLEKRYLELQAQSLQSAMSAKVLLALLAHVSPPHLASQLSAQYHSAMRLALEDALRTFADDTPNLAARLREILAHQIDEKD